MATATADQRSEPHRSNHKWMLVVCATPLLIAAVAAAVSFAGPSEPSVVVHLPAGYRSISDAYFGYAVPARWSENDSATTDTGTYFYEGPGGWAGEVLSARSDAPSMNAAGPAALGVFAVSSAVPFELTGGHRVSVPGTTVAWSYTLVRSGAAVAEVVDAWSSGSSSEIWLAVHSDPATTAEVVASLRA